MKKEKLAEPKDLGVKIGNKEEAAWTSIRDSAVEEVESHQRIIEIDKEIIKLAEKKIAEEREKFK